MGEITDLIFTLLGKAGRWFNVTGQRVCFLIWCVCLVYWMARNVQLGCMVQCGGCFFSFGMHLYGWYNWGKKGIGQTNDR